MLQQQRQVLRRLIKISIRNSIRSYCTAVYSTVHMSTYVCIPAHIYRSLTVSQNATHPHFEHPVTWTIAIPRIYIGQSYWTRHRMVQANIDNTYALSSITTSGFSCAALTVWERFSSVSSFQLCMALHLRILSKLISFLSSLNGGMHYFPMKSHNLKNDQR